MCTLCSRLNVDSPCLVPLLTVVDSRVGVARVRPTRSTLPPPSDLGFQSEGVGTLLEGSNPSTDEREEEGDPRVDLLPFYLSLRSSDSGPLTQRNKGRRTSHSSSGGGVLGSQIGTDVDKTKTSVRRQAEVTGTYTHSSPSSVLDGRLRLSRRVGADVKPQ